MSIGFRYHTYRYNGQLYMYSCTHLQIKRCRDDALHNDRNNILKIVQCLTERIRQARKYVNMSNEITETDYLEKFDLIYNAPRGCEGEYTVSTPSPPVADH